MRGTTRKMQLPFWYCSETLGRELDSPSYSYVCILLSLYSFEPPKQEDLGTGETFSTEHFVLPPPQNKLATPVACTTGCIAS